MFNLRDKDALRREKESFARAREAAAELDARICEAMDRWAGEAAKAFPDEPETGERAFGYRAIRVLASYGVVL